MKKEKTLRIQTLGEEIGNAVSHGIGALLGVFGTVILIIRGTVMNNLAAVLLGIFYGVSLTLLYTVSCLYHSLKRNRAKKGFQNFGPLLHFSAYKRYLCPHFRAFNRRQNGVVAYNGKHFLCSNRYCAKCYKYEKMGKNFPCALRYNGVDVPFYNKTAY